MGYSRPFDLLTGTLRVYVAPVGSAEPDVTDEPVLPWVELGCTDGEQSLQYMGELTFLRDELHQGPVRAVRPDEDVVVRLTLVGLTLENYARILSQVEAVETDDGAAPETRTVPMVREFLPQEYALLLRGEAFSPYGAWPGMCVIPRGSFDGEPQLAFSKDGRAALEVEFHAMEDASQAEEYVLGWIEVQSAARETFRVLFAGTFPNCSIYRSDDGGETWGLVQALGQQGVFTLCDAGNGVLLAGTSIQGRIFRSTDAGLTWGLVYATGNIVYKIVHLGAGVCYAAINGSIHRSDDRGATWGLVQALGSQDYIYDMVALSDTVLVAATNELGGSYQIWRSTDSGLTWGFQQTVSAMGLVSLGDGIGIAGGSIAARVFRSTDYGAVWGLAQTISGTQSGLRPYDLGGGVVLVGSYLGGYISRSVDYGASWNLVAATESYVYEFARVGTRRIVAGTGSGGRVYISVDSGLTWAQGPRLGSETAIRCLLSIN